MLPLLALAGLGPLPTSPPEAEVAPFEAKLAPPATFPHGCDDDDDGDRDVGGHCPKIPASAHITATAANCVGVWGGGGGTRVHY